MFVLYSLINNIVHFIIVFLCRCFLSPQFGTIWGFAGVALAVIFVCNYVVFNCLLGHSLMIFKCWL